MRLLDDVRYGVRLWSRNPSFAAIIILTLALAIGVNSAVFSTFDAVVLHPLPFNESERLVMLWETNPQANIQKVTVSSANFFDWRRQSRSFDGIAGFSPWTPAAEEQNGPEVIEGVVVSADLFTVLGASPILGRSFTQEDSRPGGDNQVVLISYRFWQRYFGGDRTVVGRSLKLQELNSGWRAYTVVGVMPAGFSFPYSLYGVKPDVWGPLVLDAHTAIRVGHNLDVLARLKSGVSLAQARTELNAIAQNLEAQYPATNRGWGVILVPLADEVIGHLRLLLLVLLGASCFVLLIACLNVSGLFLARYAIRKQEIALRAALGATRSRLVCQLLIEDLILAVVGSFVGLFFCYFWIQILRAFGPSNVPRPESTIFGTPVVFFNIAMLVFAVLAFGLAPAVHATRFDLSEVLKEAGPATGSRRGSRRLYRCLVVSQVALSLVLLIGASLLIRSLYDLQRVRFGFLTKEIFTEQLVLPGFKYQQPGRRMAFARQLLQKIQTMPHVVSVSAASDLPGREIWKTAFTAGETQPSHPSAVERLELREVTSDYFFTMGIPLLEGRVFTESDSINSPPVVVISRATADKYWSNEDPLGKRIMLQYEGSAPFTIVGVVGDTRHFGFETEPQTEAYVPFSQLSPTRMQLLIRVVGTAKALGGVLHSEINSTDSDIRQGNVESMDELLEESVSRPRFQTFLLSALAGLAYLLAIVGIYGVVSYSVAQRRREISIRMALGAEPRRVLWQVMGEGGVIALIGEALGIALSVGLTRYLTHSLYGVKPTDPATFLVVSIVFGGTISFASFIPARRAATIDPMTTLRCE